MLEMSASGKYIKLLSMLKILNVLVKFSMVPVLLLASFIVTNSSVKWDKKYFLFCKKKKIKLALSCELEVITNSYTQQWYFFICRLILKTFYLVAITILIEIAKYLEVEKDLLVIWWTRLFGRSQYWLTS